MKFLVLVLGLACTVAASLEEGREQWANFKTKHGKLYKNLQEEKTRFAIFQQNLQAIEEHNRLFEAGKVTYTKAVNQFADLTKEEFVAFLKRSSSGRPKTTPVHKKLIPVAVPDSIDWRDKGAVSKVKNQGNCGSCWSFSATGVLESHYFLKNNKMVLFSEQQVVDCDEEQAGCGGGFEYQALEYIKDNGIETEDSYPYEGADNSCRYDSNKRVDLKISKVINDQSVTAEQLKQAVGSLGPIAVALDASDLSSYSGGVYQNADCSSEYLDHAVLAVGYGHDDATGLDYWLIKNSWSETWGEDGYFKILRGSNHCGIESEIVYPVLG